MSRYAALIAWARDLGRNDFADVLTANPRGRDGGGRQAQRHSRTARAPDGAQTCEEDDGRTAEAATSKGCLALAAVF
jgi:hypothetical protein